MKNPVATRMMTSDDTSTRMPRFMWFDDPPTDGGYCRESRP
jgi:hypothetical protein